MQAELSLLYKIMTLFFRWRTFQTEFLLCMLVTSQFTSTSITSQAPDKFQTLRYLQRTMYSPFFSTICMFTDVLLDCGLLQSEISQSKEELLPQLMHWRKNLNPAYVTH